MSFIKTIDGTRIYNKDSGSGRPIVFSHGSRLSADAWNSWLIRNSAEGEAHVLVG
jgi:non-heme chloroperoxidase